MRRSLTIAASIAAAVTPTAAAQAPPEPTVQPYAAAIAKYAHDRAHERAHARRALTRARARYRPIARRLRTVAPHRGHLLAIAACESTSRWHIATGNGFYGGLQFTLRSWRAVGGRGLPHQASPLEQMYRAVLLSHLQGWGAWPVCG